MCSEPLLHTAVKAAHLNIVQYLVAEKADVNAVCDRHRTPLREALEARHTAIAESLRGAYTAIAESLRSAGAFEKSLQVAAKEGDVTLVQAWLLVRFDCVHDVGW